MKEYKATLSFGLALILIIFIISCMSACASSAVGSEGSSDISIEASDSLVLPTADSSSSLAAPSANNVLPATSADIDEKMINQGNKSSENSNENTNDSTNENADNKANIDDKKAYKKANRSTRKKSNKKIGEQLEEKRRKEKQETEQESSKRPSEPNTLEEGKYFYLKIIGPQDKGVLEQKKGYVFSEGITAVDALTAVVGEENCRISDGYVQEIRGIAEFDYGPTSGWVYSINGVYPSISANSYILKLGDVLVWEYTLKRISVTK